LVGFEPAVRDALAQDVRQLIIARQKIVGVDHFRHGNPCPLWPGGNEVMTTWIIGLIL